MFVSVLGTKTGGDWSMVALEMDIWAYAKTAKEALRQLAELVSMQISFAHHKGQPEMIYRPADPRFFEVFYRVREESLKSVDTPRRAPKYRALGMPIHVPPEVREFTMQHAPT